MTESDPRIPTSTNAEPAIDAVRVLAALRDGETLPREDADRFFESLLTGALDEAQIGAALAMLATRPITVDEVVGAASAMRRHVTRVPFTPTDGRVLIDTCGTGGTPKLFNVSTVAAIIIASAEPPAGRPRAIVAKHGNRSRTGRGSAEVLAELGVDVDASPEAQAACLAAAGVCFSFAIRHHPAMRYAAAPRRSLGFRTIFNVLGPLTNPAGAPRQVVGVYAPELVPVVGEALAALGVESAAVLHARDGYDEVSINEPTDVVWVGGDLEVHPDVIDPRALGIDGADHRALVVDDVASAAEAARGILSSGDTGPRASMAHLNAAVGLRVAGVVDEIADGLELAREACRSGRAIQTLDTLCATSHNPGASA